MYISTNQILITRQKTDATSGMATFNMSEYDNGANSFKAVCASVSDPNNVFLGFWTGDNTIYYFNYSLENDGMYYGVQEGTYPGTATIGPNIKQVAAK